MKLFPKRTDCDAALVTLLLHDAATNFALPVVPLPDWPWLSRIGGVDPG